MLGIDYTSSQQYFIQSRIITENPLKINPFLKKILSGAKISSALPITWLSRPKFFTKTKATSKCSETVKVTKVYHFGKVLCNFAGIALLVNSAEYIIRKFPYLKYQLWCKLSSINSGI